MKKSIVSLFTLMFLVSTICTPVKAIEVPQVEASDVIATDEFVVHLTDETTRYVYPVTVRTQILYTKSNGLGFYIYAFSGLPIITDLKGFVEYNTSLDGDHGIIVRYSESNNPVGGSIEWLEYTGNKYDSGVKITASFSGEVVADEGILDDDAVVDGYFFRTIEATIP